MREWEEKEKEQFHCTQEIFNFSHLLWWIVYLQVVCDNLKLLDLGVKLTLPTLDQFKHTYMTNDWVDGKNGEEESDEAQEIQLLTQNGGLISIFQRWIQLQVT